MPLPRRWKCSSDSSISRCSHLPAKGTRRMNPGPYYSSPPAPHEGALQEAEDRMNPEDVKMIGVAGCGIMGSGIIEVCAKADIPVVFVEVDEGRVKRGREAIERSLEKAVQRGK